MEKKKRKSNQAKIGRPGTIGGGKTDHSAHGWSSRPSPALGLDTGAGILTWSLVLAVGKPERFGRVRHGPGGQVSLVMDYDLQKGRMKNAIYS